MEQQTDQKKTASPEMENYFKVIDDGIKKAYGVATNARKKGYDPEEKVDIPIARNMAERVEGLISAVAPEIMGSGITPRINELEKTYGALAWEVALIIAEEVAKEKFCKFSDRKKAIETGIRVGMAYSTAGIVAAPLEGFVEVRFKKRKDGKEYMAVCYAGPIRGAGGTAAAFSVIISDYVRKKMGIDKYDPDENEVGRYCTEIEDYHERVTNLQYHPTKEEIEFLARNLPIEIDGNPTEEIEVFNYKDLPRVETNRIRGGVCLVMAEGISQKATKLWKRLKQWGAKFELEWGFLEEFLALQKKIKGKLEKEEKRKLTPNYVYISDLVAGRPVLTHPMREGGFRLRYGRSRTSGYSACSLHPATQFILNRYLATGTQIKVERPGKAAAITVCDTIEGPIVKLNNGDVLQLSTISEAKRLAQDIKEILFLGDILFNYGDFSENNHFLVPPGYCEEWYLKEIEKATVNNFGSLDMEKLSEMVGVSTESLNLMFKKPQEYVFDANAAFEFSKRLKVPLHPAYTYYWSTISKEQLLVLLNWLKKGRIERSERIDKLIIPLEEGGKRVLEILGIPHTVATNEYVVVGREHSTALLSTFGIKEISDVDSIIEKIKLEEGKATLEMINLLSPVILRDKAGTFIGARMGRPEKAKMRELTGSPQVLFPVGEEGGRLRCFQSALEAGKITSHFPIYKCCNCNRETIYRVCEVCDKKTTQLFICKTCGPKEGKVCQKHGENISYLQRSIDSKHFFSSSLSKLKMKDYPDLIKGVRGTSNKDHIPENLCKGILRAKHGIYVNKEGTTRYDMTELPITHFKPREIKTSVIKLKELGYEKDIKGRPLENEDQIVELRPQDVILPSTIEALDEPADEVLFKVANFIDDLLVSFYGLKSYYNLKSKNDLVGHLAIGLAPHISAGTVCRIIGFSETQGMYAHPLMHAAMRRDCDGDEACVMLLMDALLNFSRQYLPDKRGGRTMDSPLVLTSKINPSEVDDMVHGLDVVWSYPLEFYEAALQYKYAHEIEIEQLKKRLGTEKQYEGIGFTHDITNINSGVNCSAYKTLPSMEEKLKGQMDLAEKIRAVDESDVAKLVIEKHFIKDTKGNLRKFSMQEFRCTKCNEKFRRPPLAGRCTKCAGNIIFTISEGSVIKYLEPSMSLANKYNVPAYLKQTLELTKRRIEGVFGKDKEVQRGLGAWFG
ncbi:DNA polymerase II large subunit [Candidatus Woesearchaeota archaeon CG10_big_fil_rev_8_21_14_0_10_44_13]|nr:MAG: DNA polymerase II large subunit [Candidatus Woesearchaeota archaeon CG10_big_fil_rev_8_21_14_0_10_44_13]